MSRTKSSLLCFALLGSLIFGCDLPDDASSAQGETAETLEGEVTV